MTFSIEARYLDVKWADEHTVLKLEKSTVPLDIEGRDGDYILDSVTFRKYLPRLAFKILDNSVLHEPYFKISGQERKALLSIKDPATHETWWIESTGWDKKNKRHHSELWRTVGNVQLKIQNKNILIRNNSIGFSVKELEAYLQDFKNDLWMLILGKEEYIKGDIERKLPVLFDADLMGHLNDYVNSVEKVIRCPTIELKETQNVLPVRSVRPVNRTFMELAVKGAPSHLTSRSYLESKDTPENRYAHHTVKRVLYLAKQIHLLGQSQQEASSRFIESEKVRLASFTEEKAVDEVVFNNELRDCESQLQALYKSIGQAVGYSSRSYDKKYASYKVKLTSNYGYSDNGEYFCEFLDGENFKSKHKTYLVVKLPEVLQLPVLVDKNSRVEIELTGEIDKEPKYNNNNILYYLLTFHRVIRAVIIDHPFLSKVTKMKVRRDELGASSWQTPYTANEKAEIEREITFIERRVSMAEKRNERLDFNSNEVGKIYERLRRLKEMFTDSGIGIDSNFPNKMVFVQNPNYSSLKSAYSYISRESGIDESLFESMSVIQQVGLVNISNLYEKWCLLKIIGVLTDIYGFSIEGDWKKKLISAVSRKKYDVEFELKSETLRRNMRLTYEKQLASGKRPDFVLDISSYNGGEGYRKYRYVLDAKFRDNLNDVSLADLVEELYAPAKKNYSEEESNAVFVIHASNEAISQRTSPLNWGRHSDYGQKHRHKYGGVYLSPSLKHERSSDNLQRLIGLFLEESNQCDYANENGVAGDVVHNVFCIACGISDPSRLELNLGVTKGGSKRWTMRCASCYHLHVNSNCMSCETRLKKNGHYWTYHRTLAEQPFNVICPKCQDSL